MTWATSIRQKIEPFLQRHKRLFIPIAIVGGFIADIFTLNRIDQVFDNALLIAHIIIVGVGIALLFSRGTPLGRRVKINNYQNIVSTIVLFSFGALFSGALIFYGRSGSFISSAPFILLILGLMLGTEFFKRFYQRLVFQIAFYFITVYAYLIILVALLTNSTGVTPFIISGILSVLYISVYSYMLSLIDPYNFNAYAKKIIISLILVAGFFNFFYFTNILPPVPLSMKFNAVYHDVEKLEGSGYRAVYEETASLHILRKRSRRLTWEPGERVYVFTSVFAPKNLSTTIAHQWEYYDKEEGWTATNSIPIGITGGRVEGFRGYSYKDSLTEGAWRVRVANDRGQTLGFIRFALVSRETPRDRHVEEL